MFEMIIPMIRTAIMTMYPKGVKVVIIDESGKEVTDYTFQIINLKDNKIFSVGKQQIEGFINDRQDRKN